ncbi:DUF7793 family protein [Sinomicrobium sp. M5D2P17]
MMYFKDYNPGVPWFENKYAWYWIDRNILYFVYKPNTVIDLDAAITIVADRLKLQKEKSFPVFCDTSGLKEVRKAARDFLAQEGSALANAVSILAPWYVSRVISVFYIKVSRPLVPTKTFTDKDKALQFLESFISP